VLEETGMIVIVGEWVLRSVCNQQRRWQQEGLRPLRVSVNVSALQFQNPSFVASVQRVLRETGVSPSLIELELTESLLMRNAEQASATIGALKTLGLGISIDDFGTGYSSLNYLRNLSVDYLKIDRSFVSEIATSARDRAIAGAIAELANALGITLIAEGVENEAQASFFSSTRYGELQGFMFSKALPPEQVRRYLMPAAGPATLAPAP
jgi:EAL domain-containing protein (putative c-di-GMP-specific phosphodiesterase class I)